jgi:hypothetical protein
MVTGIQSETRVTHEQGRTVRHNINRTHVRTCAALVSVLILVTFNQGYWADTSASQPLSDGSNFTAISSPESHCPPSSASDPSVTTVPAPLGLSSLYQKYIDASGIAIVSSANVCDRALQVAYEIVTRELAGPMGSAIAKNLIHNKVRVAIFSNVNGEKLTDLPEERRYAGDSDFPDSRCGGGAVHDVPVTTVCEGNLLSAWWESLGPRYFVFDDYRGRESVLVHEFGHTIQNLGLNNAIRKRIENAYKDAQKQKLFPNAKGTPSYMMTNSSEFFAECTLIWFNAVDSTNPVNAPLIWERPQLQKALPEMYEVLATIYPTDNWHWPKQ